MMTARFLSGASLFALLIVDICCFPAKKGLNPGASYGSTYTNTAPSFGSNHGGSSPGAGMSHSVPSYGVATTYDAVAQPGPSVSQPTGHGGPAASVGSSSSSGSAFSGSVGAPVRPAPAGSRGAPVRLDAASAAHLGAGLQSGPRDIQWAVVPLGLLSASKEMSTGPRGASTEPQYVSPPEAMYQAGELSHYEQSFEHGNSERESEEQGSLPPPPFPIVPLASEESAEYGLTSQPVPEFIMGGGWFPHPYPYYNYRFLTGQYPTGTYTHSSHSFEEGRDHWEDVHYERYHTPSDDGSAEVPEPPADPKTPVKKPVPSQPGGRKVGYGYRY